jgi:hypothetical protein
MLTLLTTLKSARFLFGIGGYFLAAFFVFLWLNGRDNLASQREACNTAVQASAAQAQKVAREVSKAAFEARLAQKEAQITSERNAREIADRARLAAESRPERVKTVIREVASENSCMDMPIPEPVVERLRS